MGPVGPWATGRVDWGPLSGLTGTRPVVDKYSITRYSEGEWRKHNEEVLTTSADDLHKINVTEFNSRRALESISKSADQNQWKSTKKLAERTHEIFRWKTEVERAIDAITEECKMLESERRRTSQARSVLGIVRSISNECMSRRGMREGYELARDKIEEELIKEAALVNEVGGLMQRTLLQIEEQLARNKSVKARLEDDWSDKHEAHAIDLENAGLNNRSSKVLFKPASTRFAENQASPAGWINATREVLATAEAVRCQSSELRSLLAGPILNDCVRDLKAQAEKVDMAFARGITDTELCVKAMRVELDVVVRRNSESEKLIFDLEAGVRGLDKATKVVQTRLDNRLQRPRYENARDKAQFGLIEEAKSLSDQTTTLKAQLEEAKTVLHSLVKARGVLEKELQNKLKTLYIDKVRCQAMRAQYPSAAAMIGN
ncbi:hypothetical protein AAG570_006801 [Ranatra chinensis]|uniref:Tektin n=1 Tax=Ranatra chinensis TaxID=642074 RepID=A0ABD0YV48_9HEMI